MSSVGNKNVSDGSGIQTWSRLPLETIGDYRELGFVHGSNGANMASIEIFPCDQAEDAYNIGWYAGAVYHQPCDNHGGDKPGYTYTKHGIEDAQTGKLSVEHTLKGSDRVAYRQGYDYGTHTTKYPRTIKYF